MNSELRRDDKKDKFVITYTLTTSVLLFQMFQKRQSNSFV